MSVDKDASLKFSIASKDVQRGGQPFTVYHILVYFDDLNPIPQLFPRWSVGFCYLLLLEHSYSRDNTTSSTRTGAIAQPRLCYG